MRDQVCYRSSSTTHRWWEVVPEEWASRLEHKYSNSLLGQQVLFQCNVGMNDENDDESWSGSEVKVKLLEEDFFSFDRPLGRYGPLCFVLSLGALRECGIDFERGNPDHWETMDMTYQEMKSLIEECKTGAINLTLDPRDWAPSAEYGMCETEEPWKIFLKYCTQGINYMFVYEGGVFTNCSRDDIWRTVHAFRDEYPAEAREFIYRNRIVAVDDEESLEFGQTYDGFPVRRSGEGLFSWEWARILQEYHPEYQLPLWMKRAFDTYNLFPEARCFIVNANPQNQNELHELFTQRLIRERFDIHYIQDHHLPWWTSWRYGEDFKECRSTSWLTLENFQKCCLAFEFDDDETERFLYRLPLEIDPGSTEALNHWNDSSKEWPDHVRALFLEAEARKRQRLT